MHRLFYKQPARFWEEALPLGNGRMGAMLFGGVDRERIQLNEDTLWSGRPGDERGYKIKENIEDVRNVLREGRYAEATRLTDEMTGAHDSQSYQMAGDLLLDFGTQGPVSGYERDLDLKTAIASTQFEANGKRFVREAFTATTHQVFAIRVSTDSASKIRFDLSMRSKMRADVSTAGNNLVLNGQCPLNNQGRGEAGITWEQDGLGGIKYVVKARVLTQGGSCSAKEDGFTVKDADDVVILVAIKTGFLNWHTDPLDDVAELERLCDARLDKAEALRWDELKRTHIQEHGAMYERMALDLKATDDRPTDEILKHCQDPAENRALVNLVFNYGRYLLISSSRPGTQPANLQGIWNDHLLAPWRSNYTTNINTEMNYWPAETCNLADCVQPLIQFIDEMRFSGRRAASGVYGARDGSWCLHHNADLWRYCFTGGSKAQHAFWPVCGAWLCQHLWEHYQFSGNKEFLVSVFPKMKNAAAFFLDFMVEDEEGNLVTSPSTSPENTFVDPSSGESASVCMGSAMDLTLVRELFENVMAASKVLGMRDALVQEVEAAYDRVPLPKIGSNGRLLEFGVEAEEPQPKHRHISHLYGVYPGWMFTPDQHSDLYEACRKSLDARGDKSTGWAMGWRVAMWARLLDGNRALNVMGSLLTYKRADREEQRMSSGGGLYLNLFDAHPPFQIDGNFGATAGIVEMLVQSHREADGVRLIDLLPALPDAWPEGCVRGVRARGGLALSFCWSAGKVESLEIKARQNVSVRVRMNDSETAVSLKQGEIKTL